MGEMEQLRKEAESLKDQITVSRSFSVKNQDKTRFIVFNGDTQGEISSLQNESLLFCESIGEKHFSHVSFSLLKSNEKHFHIDIVIMALCVI